MPSSADAGRSVSFFMKKSRPSHAVLASLLASLMGLFAIWSALRGVPEKQYFGPDHDPFVLADRMPMIDLKEIKIRHALRVERFDVGLFGNSRIIQVSQADFNYGNGRFFNFAIPGSSIRNSISMLDR
jgi:hypothetical protein